MQRSCSWSTGTVGPPGPSGPAGPPGPAGTSSSQGQQGPVGAQGHSGPRGERPGLLVFRAKSVLKEPRVKEGQGKQDYRATRYPGPPAPWSSPGRKSGVGCRQSEEAQGATCIRAGPPLSPRRCLSCGAWAVYQNCISRNLIWQWCLIERSGFAVRCR